MRVPSFSFFGIKMGKVSTHLHDLEGYESVTEKVG
jgi:hypothetical protein